MPHISQVNYEELSLMAKHFHTEGDDLVQLRSQTRQRLQALHADWAGEAAEAFFEEMETALLPALQRVAGAAFLSEEVLNKIMKIIHEADEETAGYFKDGVNADFGAGLFGGLMGGGLGSLLGAAGEDFGAGQFGEALGSEGGPPTGSESGDLPEPFGLSEVPGDAPKSNYLQMEPPTSDSTAPETPPTETETAAAAGGGGGGGGGSSQGLQGDLKGLGTGVGGTSQSIGAASGGPAGMPDHIYEGASGGSPGANPAPASPGGGGGGAQEASPGSGLAGAAGAAGVLGAAAAGAAKVLKTDQVEPDE